MRPAFLWISKRETHTTGMDKLLQKIGFQGANKIQYVVFFAFFKKLLRTWPRKDGWTWIQQCQAKITQRYDSRFPLNIRRTEDSELSTPSSEKKPNRAAFEKRRRNEEYVYWNSTPHVYEMSFSLGTHKSYGHTSFIYINQWCYLFIYYMVISQ